METTKKTNYASPLWKLKFDLLPNDFLEKETKAAAAAAGAQVPLGTALHANIFRMAKRYHRPCSSL